MFLHINFQTHLNYVSFVYSIYKCRTVTAEEILSLRCPIIEASTRVVGGEAIIHPLQKEITLMRFNEHNQCHFEKSIEEVSVYPVYCK